MKQSLSPLVWWLLIVLLRETPSLNEMAIILIGMDQRPASPQSNKNLIIRCPDPAYSSSTWHFKHPNLIPPLTRAFLVPQTPSHTQNLPSLHQKSGLTSTWTKPYASLCSHGSQILALSFTWTCLQTDAHACIPSPDWLMLPVLEFNPKNQSPLQGFCLLYRGLDRQ